jgi:hypothetical protein
VPAVDEWRGPTCKNLSNEVRFQLCHEHDRAVESDCVLWQAGDEGQRRASSGKGARMPRRRSLLMLTAILALQHDLMMSVIDTILKAFTSYQTEFGRCFAAFLFVIAFAMWLRTRSR